jgi:hypothetical protein
VEASRVQAASARSEPLDDLPAALILFVRVGAGGVEVQLVGVHLSQEIAALPFFQAIAVDMVTAR